MKARFFVVIALLFITSSVVGAFPVTKGKMSIFLGWGVTYDDNLMKYSERDRDWFKRGIEFSPSPIRSLNDVRNDFRATAEYAVKSQTKRTTTLRGIVNFAQHWMDPIKNFGWTSLGVKHELTKQWTVGLSYMFEPHFFIRDFKDIHTGSFQNCSFALDQTTLDIAYHPVWLWEVSATGRIKNYAYNKYFTEYNGQDVESELTGIIRTGDWRFSLGYGFGRFDNTGYSANNLLQSGSSIIDSEEGQGDYDEDSYNASARYNFLTFGKKSSADLLIDIGDRHYTTKHNSTVDPMHSYRQDTNITLEVSGRMNVTPELEVEVGVGHYKRGVEANVPLVAEIKNFNRNTGWVKLNYQLR
jgi:hypothetical protein